jgi:DNA-binding transcriptional LysR family regulator
MDWSDLRVFLAIVRAGSLGGAAKALKLSQPTMGRHLRSLEQALGRVLFQRTRDGVVPTVDGIRLVKHAERMEEEVNGILRQMSDEPSSLEGTLKVNLCEWFGSLFFPPVLSEFSQTHPRVKLELGTNHRPPNLSRREADVSFQVVPFEESDVIARRLFRINFGVYVSTESETPAAGNGEGMKIITRVSNYDYLTGEVWLKKMLPSAKDTVRCNSREVQAQMCMLGMGVAVLPRPMGDSLEGLRLVDLSEDPPYCESWVGYHRDQSQSPIIRALVNLAILRLGPRCVPTTSVPVAALSMGEN